MAKIQVSIRLDPNVNSLVDKVSENQKIDKSVLLRKYITEGLLKDM